MNASGMSVESPQWFVLNHIRTDFQHVAKKEVERFNAWQGSSLVEKSVQIDPSWRKKIDPLVKIRLTPKKS